jgi:Na+/melibiose symporter-like transporter
MGALGYVSKYGTIGQNLTTAHNMCWLVAGLYLFSAVVQFIGLALVYNLDRKTLDQMNQELAARKAQKGEAATEEAPVEA